MKNSLIKILIFIFTLVIPVQASAFEASLLQSNIVTSGTNKGKVIYDATHVTFTLSSDGYEITNGDDNGLLVWYRLPRNTSRNVTLSWTVKNPDGYEVEVTNISFKAKAYTSNSFVTSSAKVSFNGGDPVSVGTASLIQSHGWSSTFGGDGKYTSGVIIKLQGETSLSTFDFHFKEFSITYSVKPKIITTNGSVNITVCPSNTTTVNLAALASLADGSHGMSLSYSVTSANASYATISGTNFSATRLGNYTIQASVAAQRNCHDENSKTFTVTVTPATLALTAPTASDITYPATLASSTLTGGSAMIGSCEVAGTWAWQTSSTMPSIGDGQSFPVVFTPSENAEYYTNFVTNATINVLAFIFTGEGDDDEQANVWVKDDNWNVDNTPTIDNVVIIRHDVVVEDEVEAYSVTIEDGYTLTIAPNGGLTVGAGGIIGATKSNLILKADADAKSATKGKTGYLRISPAYTGAMPQATVELYSKAYYDYDDKTDNIAKWQYVGSPLASTDVMAKTVYTTSWIYSWNEGADKWFNERKTLKFTPFVGYATTQRTYPDGILLSYTGQLVSNQGKHDIDLAWSDEDHGYNAIANSFAAPIDITKFSDEDFFHADSVVYIFNTGSRSQAMAAAAQKSPSVNTPGQFLAIPIGSIRMLKKAFDEMPTTIASMQGFFVHALAEDARVTMEYDKLVWNGDYGKNPNVPIRAPKLRDDADDEVLGALQISLFSDMGGDHLFMLESEQFNSLYENGIDARKLMGDALNIFSVAGNDQLAVDATNSITGTRVGVRTGEETAYTIAFNNLRSEKELALLDNETEQTIDIEEGVEYTFFAEPNTVIADRFMIVERDNADKPGVTTDFEQTAGASKAHKFIQNGQLFILKNGVLYDAMGNVVR